jgi:Na+/H+ antiporter NhaA
LALAIADDIGAILIIAVLYTAPVVLAGILGCIALAAVPKRA